MSDKLAEICAATRLHVERCRGAVPLPLVERRRLLRIGHAASSAPCGPPSGKAASG